MGGSGGGGSGDDDKKKKDPWSQFVDTATTATEVATGGLLTQTHGAQGIIKPAEQRIVKGITGGIKQSTAAATGGLLTQTDKGKETLENAPETTQQILDNVSGETARRAAEAESARAEAERQRQAADLAEEKFKKGKAGEYSRIRSRQRAIMGEKSGRAGTILTGQQGGTGSGGFYLGSSGSGKTLLGS